MGRKKIAPERKKEIIAGLYKCLANKGHEQVSVKDIAEAAGVSRGVIHYYFESKKDIMLAVVDDFIEGHETLFRGRLQPIEDPWERLRLFISLAVEHTVVDPEATMFFLNIYQMAMTDEDVRVGTKASYAHFRGVVRLLIEYGVSRGEFEKVDAEKLAFYLIGCMEGMWLQVAMDPGLFDAEEIEKLVYESAVSQLAREQS